MSSLAGKDINFWVKHTTYTSGLWKMAVCATDNTLSLQKTESTVITKCGSETIAGTDDDSISLTLTFLTDTPEANELTADTLETIYLAGAEFEWRITDAYPSPSYMDKQGEAVGTALEESFPAEGMTQYAFTFKVNGAITKNL